MTPRKLLTFEFVGLCFVAFLAICNVTVFYDLVAHLASVGVPPGLRGLLVGAAPATAMLLYLVASPFLGPRRAPLAMLLGMAVLAASGLAYLFVHSPWGLLGLRLLNGLGQFLLGGGATALLVTFVPPERAGQAFAVYSVAILVAFGFVPTVMDAAAPYLGGRDHGYAAATVSILPALWVVLRLRRRLRETPRTGPRDGVLRWSEIRENLAAPAVAILIVLNTGYFANWSGLYFLFEGFAREQGMRNVGAFFGVVTGLMIVIRLLAGRLFDRLNKLWLMAGSFGIIALGHLALGHTPPALIPLVGALFGLGLGAGYPAINGLMFDCSTPRFRALNANLMMFAVQGGSFLGPSVGGVLVAHGGYRSYFLASVAMALGSVGLTGVLARVKRPRGEAYAGAGPPRKEELT